MKLTPGTFADEIDGTFKDVQFSLHIRGDVWDTDAGPGLHDEIIRRVNAHYALVEALNNIASEPMPMIGDVETCRFILRRIDGIATAALALAEKGETS